MDTTYQHYCKPQNIILAYFRQIACRVSLMCVPVVFCHTKQWHGLSSEQLQPGYCLSHCLLQSDAVRQQVQWSCGYFVGPVLLYSRDLTKTRCSGLTKHDHRLCMRRGQSHGDISCWFDMLGAEIRTTVLQ